MKKKLLSLLMIMAIIAGVVFQPVYGSMTAEAKTPFMKTLGLKWDLKEGKWVKIRSNFAGNVWLEHKATIKDVKLKNAKKEGYKKLSYTIVIKEGMLTPDQVHKVALAYYNNDEKFYEYEYSVNCYDIDGFNMHPDYDSDIKVNYKWTYSKKKNKVEDSDGHIWTTSATCKVKCTVVYPEKDYKKICIGISGNGSYKAPNSNDNLWERPVYKKDKKNIHFMLVG